MQFSSVINYLRATGRAYFWPPFILKDHCCALLTTVFLMNFGNSFAGYSISWLKSVLILVKYYVRNMYGPPVDEAELMKINPAHGAVRLPNGRALNISLETLHFNTSMPSDLPEHNTVYTITKQLCKAITTLIANFNKSHLTRSAIKCLRNLKLTSNRLVMLRNLSQKSEYLHKTRLLNFDNEIKFENPY